MFSFEEETVLDPFLGSGTTSLAAKKLNRNSIGYEINTEFKPFIKDKLGVKSSENIQHKINFHTQKLTTNFASEIEKLPYIFKDFHNLDNKIDLKKKQFGSKLDKNGKSREVFFRVKEVISAGLIQLKDDRMVRLLGVKEVRELNEKAIQFLKDKTKNQQVFLKFDKQKHDSSDNLLAYVYLKNKTFLNAHLIKKGFAIADTEMKHKNTTKFKKLEEEYSKNG